MKATRLAAWLVVSTAGCYNTIPLGDAAPVVGQEMVVQLTDAGTRQLSGPLGQATTEVRGLYVDSSPDTVHLSMIATTLANGEDRLWSKETVGIPMQYVATISRKVLSPSKSAGASVIGIGVVIAVKAAFSGITGTKSKGTGPPAGQ